MSDNHTLESLKNHVLLDWIRFLTSQDVVALCCTSPCMKEVLDSNFFVWEHCLSVQPLLVRASRMNLPRIQRNRHCCVWHLYISRKIAKTTGWIYLLCNIDSYSFASGLVCSAFRRIKELSIDELMRHSAHRLQLHEMISKHLLQTDMEDVEEVVIGLEAIKVLSRPFVDLVIYPDPFATEMRSETASCPLRAIITYQTDLRVLTAAFDACTNLSLHRNYASYFINEGYIKLFRNIILNSHVSSDRSVLLAGLYSLRNIYDPLHISSENLEILINITVTLSRAKPDDKILVKAFITHLSQVAVWQAPHMHSQELLELLTGLVADQEEPAVSEGASLRSISRDLLDRVFNTVF